MDSSHSDFWVAIAAAGPVLALAVVVAVNSYDYRGPRQEFVQAWKDGKKPYKGGYLLGAVLGQPVSWVGFIAAGLAMLQALVSLASDHDFLPTWVSVGLLVVTFVCLPIQSLCVSAVKVHDDAEKWAPPQWTDD